MLTLVMKVYVVRERSDQFNHMVYLECEMDVYVYESPDDDEDEDNGDSYLKSTSVLHTSQTTSGTNISQRFLDVEYEPLTVLSS